MNQYPRVIDNGSGCVFGQNLRTDFEHWRKDLRRNLEKHYEERMDRIEAKLNRFLWLALGAMASFSASAVLLALNLIW